MGVDYNGIGGIGLEVTDEVLEKLHKYTKNKFIDDHTVDLIESLDISYSEAGSGSYTGQENTFYLMAEGDTLKEVTEGAKELSVKLKQLGIEIDPDDFEVISDLHVW